MLQIYDNCISSLSLAISSRHTASFLHSRSTESSEVSNDGFHYDPDFRRCTDKLYRRA